MTSGRYEEMLNAAYRFADDREWDRFHSVRNLTLALASEVGELAGEVRWLEEKAPIDRSAVASELADIQIFLLLLARRLNLDLAHEVHRKIEENERRYPVTEWRGRAGKA